MLAATRWSRRRRSRPFAEKEERLISTVPKESVFYLNPPTFSTYRCCPPRHDHNRFALWWLGLLLLLLVWPHWRRCFDIQLKRPLKATIEFAHREMIETKWENRTTSFLAHGSLHLSHTITLAGKSKAHAAWSYAEGHNKDKRANQSSTYNTLCRADSLNH